MPYMQAFGHAVLAWVWLELALAAAGTREPGRADAMAGVIAGMGLSEQEYRDYLAGEGVRDYEAAHEEAAADRIFGVPIFVFEGEPFWGHDRIGLLERRLAEAGLALESTRPAAHVR